MDTDKNEKRFRIHLTKADLRIKLTKKDFRAKLSWRPRWEPEIKGWAIRYILKTKFKLDPILTFEDLLQDAYVQYLVCVEGYPRVTEGAHFMSLYQSILRNCFYDMIQYNIRRIGVIENTFTELDDNMEFRSLRRVAHGQYQPSGGNEHTGYLNILISEAPVEVRALLAALGTDEGINELRKPLRTEAGNMPARETLNKRLCRIAKVCPTVNLVAKLKELLA